MIKKINKLLNKKGFTLVELIVVIAVLGILAGIAVPRYSGIQDRARTRADEANLKILNNAIEIYYAENGTYPSEDDITSFKSDMANYLPNDGIPAVQTSGYYFIYDKDASGNKVVYRNTDAGTGELRLE